VLDGRRRSARKENGASGEKLTNIFLPLAGEELAGAGENERKTGAVNRRGRQWVQLGKGFDDNEFETKLLRVGKSNITHEERRKKGLLKSRRDLRQRE